MIAPVLAMSAVEHRYGRRTALASVTFTVRPSECLGLVGPNGAGKTTLLRIAAGLVRPRAGAVDCRATQDEVRYFGGEATLPPAVSARRWAWAVGGCRVGERRALGRLSRGTRQMVGLSATLHRGVPRLVLLDEPWDSLDPDACRWLGREVLTLKRLGAALVISSHRFHDLVAVCDAYLFLGGSSGTWVPAAQVSRRGDAEALLAAFDKWKGGAE